MITVIGSKKATRRRVAWDVIVSGITRSVELPNRSVKVYEMMSSELKSIFRNIPKNKSERESFSNVLLEYLRRGVSRSLDENIILMFLKKQSLNYDVSDFFYCGTSPNATRLVNCAKKEFDFDKNKENEELY